MAKEYVTRCLVKKDGKTHAKGSVIKGLTEEEIKQGLAEHWLDAVGIDEDGEPAKKKPGRPPKKPEENKPDKPPEKSGTL
jgi:hypothetical protein